VVRQGLAVKKASPVSEIGISPPQNPDKPFHEKAGECQVDFSFSVGFSFSSLVEVFSG
jgi:hypothetical protein